MLKKCPCFKYTEAFVGIILKTAKENVLCTLLTFTYTPGIPSTSRDLTPERLDLGARQKGIRLLGTGDFTHPAWRKELWEKLIPAEDGLYRLREEDVLEKGVESEENRTRFVVTGEISSIYKQEGKTRKVHSLILLPALTRQISWRQSWRRSEISIPTAVRSWGCPAMICWRSCWISARRESLFRHISGRRIFPCSEPAPDLTVWRSALEICHPIFMRWRRDFLLTRP